MTELDFFFFLQGGTDKLLHAVFNQDAIIFVMSLKEKKITRFL